MHRLDIETYGNNSTQEDVISFLYSWVKADIPWLIKGPSFGVQVGLLQNEEIFNEALKFAMKLELLDGRHELDKKLNAVEFDNLEMFQKAKSICYGELIAYNACKKFWNLINIKHETLIIKVTKNDIYSNLEDIRESVAKKNVIRTKTRILEMPLKDATIKTDRILSKINDLHYKFDTKLFKKEKKYFKELRPLLASLTSPVKTNSQPGRPKISNKKAVDYLVNYDSNNAEKYIQALKNLLLSDSFFQNSPSPKKFNYLLFALHDLGDINLNYGEIENIFETFKKDLSKEYLRGRKHTGSIQNFRNQEKVAKDMKLLKKIKSLVIDLKEKNVIIRKSKLS